MKEIMKRAWEIFKTLVGDFRAKLSAALRMAWAEKKKISKIENLVKMGASRWSKGNHDRLYLNKAAFTLIDLKLERYNTGNISWAAIGDEKISNCKAKKILSALCNVYIDLKSGILCGVSSDDSGVDLLLNALRDDDVEPESEMYVSIKAA